MAEVRLFDRIMKEEDKVFDEKMLPLIEQEVKANFQATKREGEKMKISLEKDSWSDLLSDPATFDVDAMANRKLEIEAIDKKIVVIEKLYEELFAEKM